MLQDINDILAYKKSALQALLSNHEPVEGFSLSIDADYSYIDYANQKDIAINYLMRNEDFIFMVSAIKRYIINHKIDPFDYISRSDLKDHVITRYIETLKNDYCFLALDYITLDTDMTLDELNMKRFFTFKPNQSVKLRLDAEKVRIIVFDTFSDIKNLKMGKISLDNPHAPDYKQSEEVKKTLEFLDDRKKVLELLAKLLFPDSQMVNGVNQVQKALREAEERINHEGWKKYIITEEPQKL